MHVEGIADNLLNIVCFTYLEDLMGDADRDLDRDLDTERSTDLL